MQATKIKTYLTEDEGIVSLTTADAQAQLPEIVQQVAADDKRVILLQDGQEMVAIISMEAFEFLERMVEKMEDEMDLEALRKARERTEQEENVTLEELKQELGF
jgi:prevent-host-death family protein